MRLLCAVAAVPSARTSSTHGKNGALKVKRPRKGGAEMTVDARHISVPPNESISAKSAVRPRK